TINDPECLAGSHADNSRVVNATFLLEHGGSLRRVEGTIPEAVGNINDRVSQTAVRSYDHLVAYDRLGMQLQARWVRGHVHPVGRTFWSFQRHGAGHARTFTGVRRSPSIGLRRATLLGNRSPGAVRCSR